MAEEGKKISFGFSKLPKKVNIISSGKKEKSDVQYIDCLEEKSIKVKNEEPKKDDVLVIPLPKKDGSVVLDRIKSENDYKVKKEPKDVNSAVVDSEKPETLDDIAAKEILEDLKKEKVSEENKEVISVPLTTDAPKGEKESTLEDYDNIPIDQFGMAMLRGMGWAPGKGIGKNEKLVAAVKQPLLRPKGLGLGADKVIKQENQSSSNVEPIKLIKGGFVRIIAGAQKDSFGEILGFDEESGRLIVKMALGGSVATFNEFMLQGVSKQDYIKNSKVINVSKYEEYKKKEETKKHESVDKNVKYSQNYTDKKREEKHIRSRSQSSDEKLTRRSRKSSDEEEGKYKRSKNKKSYSRKDEASRSRKYSSSLSPEKRHSSTKTRHRSSSSSSIESNRNRRHSSSSPEVKKRSKKYKQKKSKKSSISSSPEYGSHSYKSHKKHKKHKSKYD